MHPHVNLSEIQTIPPEADRTHSPGAYPQTEQPQLAVKTHENLIKSPKQIV